MRSTLRRNRTRLPDDIQDPAELEGLARGVLKSPKRYLELDRLLVYEALGESVERFQGLLVGAALRDPAPDNVIAVDRMLCAASERYKMSHERERALARFEDSDVPRQKDYATRELAALRQAPEGRRTHVEFEQAWSPVSTPAIIAIVLAAALAVACGVLLHRARKRRCASRGESPGVQSEP